VQSEQTARGKNSGGRTVGHLKVTLLFL